MNDLGRFPAVPRRMSVTHLVRLTLSWRVALTLIAGLLPFSSVPTTRAAEAIVMPFPGGQAARIIQGYNGGSHQGRSRYGLDLVLASGSTSGAEVVSPIDGSVSWAQGPGAGNGCIGIAFRDGSYSITLCHVLFHRTYRRGESIGRGQSLGTVGPAGTVGNNGAPHVHLELHRGGRAASPVPFSLPDGLPLEGVALPASGAHNEHSRQASIVSTNGAGSGVAAGRPAEQPLVAASAAPAQPLPARPSPARQTAAAVPSLQDRSGQPSSSAEAARSSKPTRAAVVHGTGSRLNVGERPSVDAPIVECLPDGTEVPLMPAPTGADSRWRQVKANGWGLSEYLKRTRAIVTGTETCLNVREKPSTSAPILGCIPEGAAVTISGGPASGEDFDWYQIEPAKPLDKGGWVVGQYLN